MMEGCSIGSAAVPGWSSTTKLFSRTSLNLRLINTFTSCVFCPLTLHIYKCRNVTNYTLAQKSFPLICSALPMDSIT